MKQTRKVSLMFISTLVVAVLVMAAGFFVISAEAASPPNTMNFQGRLRDSADNVVTDGLYNMQFRIYSVASGGSAVWTETRETTNRVQVTNGLFSVQLGAVNALNPAIFDATDLYFEITMATPATANCSTAGCATWESPMTPRNKLATSAYAFNAASLNGFTEADFAAASGSANYIQNASTPQTADFNITGTGTIGTVQTANLDTATATALTIGGSNATSVAVAKDMTIAAGRTITMVGGATSLRPASPSEGMIYFDSETDELLVFANASWQPLNGSSGGGDGKTATKIVAATNSSQAAKDGADFVADNEAVIGTGTIDGDQIEINAAINSLPASGGSVYLAEGTYYLDDSIVLPSNVTLSGAGNGTFVTVNDNLGSGLTMVTNSDSTNGNSGIKIRNLKFSSNYTNNSGTDYIQGVVMTNVGSASALGLSVTDTWFDDFRGRNIQLTNATNSQIQNNSFTNASDHGLEIAFSQDVRIVNNNFQNLWLSVLLIDVDGSVFSDNQVVNDSVATTDNAALVLQDSSNYNRITNNSFRDNAGISMRVSAARNNLIANNTFVDNGGTGSFAAIDISGNSNGNNLSDNVFRDNTGSGPAIRIPSGADNTQVSNNSFSGAGASSISDSSTSTIYANQIDASGKLVVRSSGGFGVQNNSGTDVLNVNATTSLLTVNGDSLYKSLTNSASAFVVQNSSSAAVFTVDTLNSKVMIGSAANGVEFSANGIVLSGTARGTTKVTLSPEYPGATFMGDGSNNNGSLHSDYCSGPLGLNNENNSCDGAAHNYYEWNPTDDSTGAQDYDVYVHYQIPSDYSTGSMSDLAIWGLSIYDDPEDSVKLTLFHDGVATACSETSEAVNNYPYWGQGSVASPLGSCNIAAGDMVTFRVRLVARHIDEQVRASAISFSYRSTR